MKRFTLAVLVLTALALYASQPPAPTGTQTGRFQIAADTATMFRIDTATGTAWQLQAVPLRLANGMTTVPTWVEIQETNGDLYRTAINSLKGL